MKRIKLRGERGGAAVEFAIIASLFLIVVFAIIEFGVLIFDYQVLTNASREGARAGIVNRRPPVYNSAIMAKVDIYSKAHLVTFGPPNSPRTDVSPSEATRTLAPFGTEMLVTVEYDFDFLVLSLVGLGPITLTAETRMRME